MAAAPAPGPAAADEADAAETCACTNIAIMQLFHELKQQFPALPDRVVSECISQNSHDKEACEAVLRREHQGYLLHSYPSCLKMSSSGACEPEGPLAARLQGLGLGLGLCGERCAAAAAGSAASGRPDDAAAVGPACSASPAHGHVHFVSQRKSANERHELAFENGHSTRMLHLQSAATSQLFSSETTTTTTTTTSRRAAAAAVARPTTLDVGGAAPAPAPAPAGGAGASSSAPPSAQHFEPFHKQPGSAGDRPQAPPAGVPYTGCYQRGPPGQPSQPSRAAPPPPKPGDRPLYSDRTVVNSYRVNVNCSVRGGGSSSVNVSGTSTQHTVVKSPDSPGTGPTTVTASAAAPRPAPPPRPPPPQPKPRARSALTVEPAPHYARHRQWGAPPPPPPPPPQAQAQAQTQQPRSYTSVNLTLRPPSTEPQAPIDIRSAGTSLMYSTSSFDPRQGFQSKLQICIGPGGAGSVSAVRTRAGAGAAPPLPRAPPVGPLVPAHALALAPPSTPSYASLDGSPDSTLASTLSEGDVQRELQAIRADLLPGPTRALLERQLERKTRLQRELRREQEKLRAMERDARAMEEDLAQRQRRKRSPAAALPQLSTLQKVQRLRQEIHLLTEECKKMTVEVDMNSDSRVPLGETDEEFYQNIYTGQQGSVASNSSRDSPRHRNDLPRQGSRQPPPRPPPPEFDPREGQSWTCSECTFRNYWELEYCEQCEMPRLLLGGETQDIHIHVTHHNFPIRSYLTVGS